MYVPELIYAKKEDGNGISINDVLKNSSNKTFLCPCCNEPVIARQGTKNKWQFAHKSKKECIGGFQTSLHLMAKDILLKSKKIYLPDIYTDEHWLYDSIYMPATLVHRGGIVAIDNIKLESHIDDIIPDITVTTSDNRTFLIEIFVTHKVDDFKKYKIMKSGFSTIEIDLSHLSREINKEELSKFLLGACKEKYWVWNKVAFDKLNNIILRKHKDFVSSAEYTNPREFLCVKAGIGFDLHKTYIGTERKDGYLISNYDGYSVYVDTIDMTNDGFDVYKVTDDDWNGKEEEVVFLAN